MTNIILALRRADLTLLLFSETERFIFAQRAEYSGERFLGARCFGSLIISVTESRIRYSRAGDSKNLLQYSF